MSNKKDLLLIVGLSGSGKSTILNHCENIGIPNFYTGEIIPSSVSEKSKINYGDSLKEESSFISMAIEAAYEKYPEEDTLIIDSIRSLPELEYVKNIDCNSYLIALVCNYETRIRRVGSRDGENVSRVHFRDQKELGLIEGSKFNTGALIGFADYYLDNSGKLEDSCHKLNEIIENIHYKRS
ncbi:MAG: AAA family ATPase [archaeon]